MQKKILITGSTDGIGLEAARMLTPLGHQILLHGRNADKLQRVAQELQSQAGEGCAEIYQADLSSMSDVIKLADSIAESHDHLDVLINNAGVFKTSTPTNAQGLDVRFVVNTITPYLLTRRLMSLMDRGSRVINLSSAAQAPVDIEAMTSGAAMQDMQAYSQSKLAITMWSRYLALQNGQDGPLVVAVNPGSLLATKMVRDGFGVAGNDIAIGGQILVRAAISNEFEDATGLYFDNDSGQFSRPHRDALDTEKCRLVVEAIESMLADPVV